MPPLELQEPAEAAAAVTLRDLLESLGMAVALVVLVFGTVIVLLSTFGPI
jgi:sulfur carrier protein ThiS